MTHDQFKEAYDVVSELAAAKNLKESLELTGLLYLAVKNGPYISADKEISVTTKHEITNLILGDLDGQISELENKLAKI